MKSYIIYLFVYLVFFGITTSCLAQTVEQPTERSAAVAGIKDKVTVRKDARAIPYIEALSDDDLYFMQGFITASDRLWQMDLYRRVASGRTAELFGKITLEEDKRWRRFGFPGIVQESYGNLSSEFKSILDNYARGVNAFIATLNKETMPTEFKILAVCAGEMEADRFVLLSAKSYLTV